MDFQANQKYFVSTTRPIYIGYGVIGFGALSLIVGIGLMIAELEFLDGAWIPILLAVIAVIAGLVIVNNATSGRANEKDIKEQLASKNDKLTERMVKKLGLENRLIKSPVSYYFGSYDYSDSEGLLVRRGKDKKVRCSSYATTCFLFTVDRLVMVKNRFSLTSEATKESEDVLQFNYTSLDECHLDKSGSYSFVCDKKQDSVETPRFILTSIESGKILDVPMDSTPDVIDFVDTLNKFIKQKKDEEERIAKEKARKEKEKKEKEEAEAAKAAGTAEAAN